MFRQNKRIILAALFLLTFFVGKDFHVRAQTTAYDFFYIVIEPVYAISSNYYPWPVSMNMSATVAGGTVNPVNNSNMYLKVTSVTPNNGSSNISCVVSGGEIPPGTLLSVIAAPCAGMNSMGNTGTVSTNPVLLNNSYDQVLVTNIGNCYTGRGLTDGYQLTFYWQLDEANAHQLSASPEATVVTISFTISANP